MKYILLIFILCGCEPERFIRECTKSHEVSGIQTVCGVGNIGGISIGGSCQAVNVSSSVCDEYSTRENKDWNKWSKGVVS